MDKQYIVKLDGNDIGFTLLESADAPMGVVAGRLVFSTEGYGYKELYAYCKSNSVEPNINDPEMKFIDVHIPKLTVFSELGVEIKGEAVVIRGFDGDDYEIDVIGIAYPFYTEEFPHHREAYEKQFQ